MSRNYWSAPMVTIFCISRFYCSNPLRITYLYWNDSIPKIESITLANALDLVHCAKCLVLLSVWKQRYYFPYGRIFWPIIWVVVLFWHISVSDPNRTWALVSVALWFFSLGVSKDCESSSTVTFLSNMFVFCGMDTGLVWIKSVVAFCTAVFVI